MAEAKTFISINKFENAYMNNVTEIPLDGVEDVMITITETLSLSDTLQFIENVVGYCVDEDTGAYTPEARDFAIRVNVLTLYANFRMPQNIEKQYDLVYGTNAYNQVMPNINQEQFTDIIHAIDNKISHTLSLITSELSYKMRELISSMNTFITNSQNIFKDFDSDKMEEVMSALSNIKSINEDKLADAVIAKHTDNTSDMGNVISIDTPAVK